MKNWKTTVTALVGYVMILVNKWFGDVVAPEVATGIVICVITLFTKDYDTTGIGYDAHKSSKPDSDPTQRHTSDQ